MRAGKLRHRVTLEFYQRLPRTPSGDTPSDWVAVDTARASIEPLRGRLLLAAQEAQSESTARIRLRWRQDVADATGKTLRFRYRGRVYRVDGRPVDPDLRGRELEVMVHEWV
ncbi:phage head closure protein [Halomonas nitroreducens]|uniref:Head-tail adaptor protein n=1 Tax=Halomonas nitroreducens TaxID=447425 RepID=A0A431V279_9GAMM|nr:phage head closure protein [Halomonas nitroreducens]RTR01942.1 head-tail adaptor protein [Halomonas nitroreducens]